MQDSNSTAQQAALYVLSLPREKRGPFLDELVQHVIRQTVAEEPDLSIREVEERAAILLTEIREAVRRLTAGAE